MIHKCNKEKEITQVVNDVQWIRRSLEGNGTTGLIKTISENSKHRIASEAITRRNMFIIGPGWLLTLIMLGWQIIT